VGPSALSIIELPESELIIKVESSVEVSDGSVLFFLGLPLGMDVLYRKNQTKSSN
jgi:hypothetical protein